MPRKFTVLLIACLASACSYQDLRAPQIGACDNPELTNFDSLLILAPHPDDEVLGFAGLAGAYVRQGKPVRTVVVTDGDAYCDACTLWTTGSINGSTCNALELSNFATPAIDSLAEARRLESTNAAALLGRPAPEFLAYPDTGLGIARTNVDDGNIDKLLRRSDFSSCASCGECTTGYGTGPETSLSANTLIDSLDELIGNTAGDTLIATTHWLDNHSDHAALGTFVSDRVSALGKRHTVAFAVIHADTAKDYASPECWYPGPAAEDCGCFAAESTDHDAGWLESVNAHRIRPDWPQVLPDDVYYGEPSQLCLDDETLLAKPQAINAFATQLGTMGKAPGILPESRKGLLDCSGYLRSFGRRTEVFVVKQLPE
jgi:LmbE family N-acetylglucosaminyl deacetylase